jgi:transglutaminase-like putative cysteine protease
MRRLRIEHFTTYQYGAPVQFLPHQLLLRPREGHDVRVAGSRLSIEPAATLKWHRDINGNSVAVATFQESADRLSIESEADIEHYDDAPLDFLVDEQAVNYPFRYSPGERLELFAYQAPVFTRSLAAVADWVARFWTPGQTVETYVLLDRMNRAIPADFAYRMREEPGVQAPIETLGLGSGSCRDFATLFIEACRHLGLAGRFVSGYLHAPATAATYGATHAWSEVYLPGAGWRGFDSTTGELVGTDHIATAVSRHPETAPPVAGAYSGGVVGVPAMTVGVRVHALD